MAVRQKKAGGGPAGAGGGGGEGRALAVLEGALREAYEAARSSLKEYQERRIELPELGDLLVEVYAKQYKQKEYSVFFKVFKRGNRYPLCEVELFLRDEKPSAVYVDCRELMDLASGCAGGGGCALSWEEMEGALGFAGWAVNRLAGLAGIPAKVEKVSLVEAYNTKDGEVDVFPCLQVSIDDKSYSVCRRACLYRNPKRGWGVDSDIRLVPIGETHAKMIGMLMELGKMVSEYIRNRESEGAERARAREYRGDFLELEEAALRLPDGTEEVLLEPWLYKLDYLGEDFAALFCFHDCPESSDSELADALRKELEEAWGEVVQAVRRYTEEQDPRYAALAYIVAEAVKRAGLSRPSPRPSPNADVRGRKGGG